MTLNKLEDGTGLTFDSMAHPGVISFQFHEISDLERNLRVFCSISLILGGGSGTWIGQRS